MARRRSRLFGCRLNEQQGQGCACGYGDDCWEPQLDAVTRRVGLQRGRRRPDSIDQARKFKRSIEAKALSERIKVDRPTPLRSERLLPETG